jgi:hypothetical protein
MKSKKPLVLLAFDYAIEETKKHREFLIRQEPKSKERAKLIGIKTVNYRLGADRGYTDGYLQALKDK